MIVEDLPPLMRERGLDVTATLSIEEAFRLFSEESFDAVLLDICMPPSAGIDPEKVEYGRETGVEIARRLKSQKPGVPIIALTVVEDPEIKARMREAGICQIINKPEDPSPVADAILKEIKGARKIVHNV